MNDLTRYMSLEFIGNGWRREKKSENHYRIGILESICMSGIWGQTVMGKNCLERGESQGKVIWRGNYSPRWEQSDTAEVDQFLVWQQTLCGIKRLLKAGLMGTKGTGVLIMWPSPPVVIPCLISVIYFKVTWWWPRLSNVPKTASISSWCIQRFLNKITLRLLQ